MGQCRCAPDCDGVTTLRHAVSRQIENEAAGLIAGNRCREGDAIDHNRQRARRCKAAADKREGAAGLALKRVDVKPDRRRRTQRNRQRALRQHARRQLSIAIVAPTEGPVAGDEHTGVVAAGDYLLDIGGQATDQGCGGTIFRGAVAELALLIAAPAVERTVGCARTAV